MTRERFCMLLKDRIAFMGLEYGTANGKIGVGTANPPIDWHATPPPGFCPQSSQTEAKPAKPGVRPAAERAS
jgi:hypothetical protein